jgi:AraC-like DNA-binding protein
MSLATEHLAGHGCETEEGSDMGRLIVDESVTFRRRDELPGVEVRDVENSARRWRCFSTGFEFLAPRTWQGEILYRRHQQAVVPGMMFCAFPEEVFTTPRVHRAGGGSAITIDADRFHAYLADHNLGPYQFDLREFVEMSDLLSARVQRVLRLMRPATSALELQSSVVELVAVIVQEIVDTSRPAGAASAANDTGADRVRECLHYDQTGLTDLERLCEQTRLSRYQVLRVFKHRYGLPPHAYQLRVRIGLAQRALRAGSAPADVAVAQGFVDQSHFTKHFKRLVGVTPAQYAHAERWLGRGGAGTDGLLQ